MQATEQAPREIVPLGACFFSGSIHCGSFYLKKSCATRRLAVRRSVHRPPGFPSRRRFRLGVSSSLVVLVLALTALPRLALARSGAAQNSAWQRVGPTGGNVISLAISPGHTVYLGAPDGHVFASRDAGRHWSLRGRISARHDAVIQRLLVDVQDENQLFAAIWFQDVRAGGGLFRSNDAGATWALTGLSTEIVRVVEQSPSTPEIFVAGTRNGVFRSTDGARSWQRISPAGDPELRNIDSVAIDPHDPETIYVGTYHLPWKTSDAGKSWKAIPSGMIDDSDIMSMRVDSASPARIFASACSGIYRSENAGALWTKLQGIPYSSRRTQAIVQDPGDPRVLYAATTEGLWVTRDGGESWARTTPREWVVNDVVVIPAAGGDSQKPPNQILLGTEAQGVLLSSDGGVTFAPANTGFSHRITAALVSDPRDSQHLLAWMPDSPEELIESRDGAARWEALSGSTSASAAPAEIARIFASDSGWWAASAKGVLSNYDAATAKWMPYRFVSTPRAAPRSRRNPSRAGPLPANPLRDNSSRGRPLAGRRGRVHESAVAPPATGSDISALHTIGARVFVTTSHGLWAGTLGDKILRPVPETGDSASTSSEDSSRLWMVAAAKILQSEDAGETWHAESANIASGAADPEVRPEVHPELHWIREVQLPAAQSGISAASPSAPTLLLAGTTQGLYRRRADNPTWQLVQNGLPASEPISCFFGNRVWVVAMQIGGLYISRDASQTWERLDTGSVMGQFTGVAVTADGNIVAASLTEGLLRYPVANTD